MEILAVDWKHAFLFSGFCLLVVFAVLTILVIILSFFGKIMSAHNTKQQTAKAAASAANALTVSGATLSEQENAALATALYLYFNDNHDKESYRITIKDVQSPWNAKFYGINNLHR